MVRRKLQEIRDFNEDAAKWIDDIPIEQWSRAYDENRRYSHMTTNLVECMNGALKGIRSLPITSLVEATLFKVLKWFVDHGRQATNERAAGHIYCEYYRNAFNKNQAKASECEVIILNVEETRFQVQEPYNRSRREFGRKFRLSLNERRCDCGEFQALRYPCCHVLAACEFASLDALQYIDPIYMLDSIITTYSYPFYVMGDVDFWPTVEGPKMVPKEDLLRPAGRPKSTRIHNEMDGKEPGALPKCGFCRHEGHNRKTCPQRRRQQ